MCSVPPPPPMLTDVPVIRKPETSKKDFPVNSSSCSWAMEYPELQKACIWSKVCLNNEPHKYQYQQLKSILQDGPTCGLVAISMLTEHISMKILLNMAKAEGYTKNGEMFSCKNMAKLTEKALANFPNVKVHLRKGDLCSEFVINKLLNKCLLLVPYDADFNHSPCLKLGHRAHWAMICGIIVSKDGGPVYVVGRQGKSTHLGIWGLKELENSNKNLWKFSPKREDDKLVYELPKGGLAGEFGIRDQYVIVEGLY